MIAFLLVCNLLWSAYARDGASASSALLPPAGTKPSSPWGGAAAAAETAEAEHHIYGKQARPL